MNNEFRNTLSSTTPNYQYQPVRIDVRNYRTVGYKDQFTPSSYKYGALIRMLKGV